MIPTIRTERLTLGPCTLDHVAAFEAFALTEASRFLGGPSDDPRDGWYSCATHAGQWVIRGYGTFWLTETATGTPVGRVGLWHPGWLNEPELSWVVYPAYEGKGIAFEAAKTALNWAANERDIRRPVSLIAPDNTRSLRLAERLGATRETDFTYDHGGTVQCWRHRAEQGEAAA